MTTGIYLLDKAKGISSAQAIAEVKRKFGLKKIGHSGTLDPMATGLLVCLTGEATRLAQYAESGRKVYSGTILFGRETSTDDVMGETLSESSDIPSWSELVKARQQFIGVISQIPPRVSALKIEGKRAYQRVLDGEDFSMKPREVEITEFSLGQLEGNQVSFQVECGKGTYIRAIARDLGRALGSLACLSSLRREQSKPFNVADAKLIEHLRPEDMISWESLLPTATTISLEQGVCQRLSMGNSAALGEVERQCDLGSRKRSPLVIYREQSSGVSMGLLQWVGQRLEFAVNLRR